MLSNDLRTGVIGMIDALGFRGIWREPDAADAAIATLKVAVNTANGMLGYYASGLGPNLQVTFGGQKPQVSVRYLSDTLIVAAEAPSSKELLSTDSGDPAM